MVAFTSTFFLLIVFNEQWCISTIVFTPCVVVFFVRVGYDYLEQDVYEVVVESIYCVFIYALIAFITEIRAKQAFLGKEQSDKVATKWLKIFETFPEGIALIRNNYILYANQSLRYILEL